MANASAGSVAPPDDWAVADVADALAELADELADELDGVADSLDTGALLRNEHDQPSLAARMWMRCLRCLLALPGPRALARANTAL